MGTHLNSNSELRKCFRFGSDRVCGASGFVAMFVLLIAGATCMVQSKSSNHNFKPIAQNTSPPASLANVAWIAGHWRGPAFGGICDEIWSSPEGNSMVGMFRLVKDGKAVFYELMTIVEENHTLVMKLKHFSPQLVGWEEKDVSQSFPLMKLGSQEAVFNGVTYRKLADGSLQIVLATKKSGEMVKEEFRLQPVKNAQALEGR